jgi:SAM-dependent methyltransferase
MDDNDAVIKQAFEKPQWYLTSTAYNIRIRCETIREFTRGQSYRNILDIGCGDGSLSLQLLSPETNITLLDRSKSMLERAVSRIPERLAGRATIVNEDFLAANLEPTIYDLVICVGVMAYVHDSEEFLRKVASILAPGGTLILECTDGSHVVSGFSRVYLAIRRMLKREGIFRTAKRSSASLLTEANEIGFELRGSFRYSLPMPGLRKVLPQWVSYRAIRTIFGRAFGNRVPWLGNECLFHLNLPAPVGLQVHAVVNNTDRERDEDKLVKR